MKLLLFDAASGQTRLLAPADPRRVRVAAAQAPAAGSLAEARARRLLELLGSVLAGAGYRVEEGGGPADVFVGPRAPAEKGALWLAPGAGGETPAAAALSRGFAVEDLRFWALRLHYRQAATGWEALEAAREERQRLEHAEQELASRPAGSAANEAALAGYSRRFRAALGRDLDVAQALQCLWDALRPGALSPATQRAALRQARGWLGF